MRRGQNGCMDQNQARERGRTDEPPSSHTARVSPSPYRCQSVPNRSDRPDRAPLGKEAHVFTCVYGETAGKLVAQLIARNDRVDVILGRQLVNVDVLAVLVAELVHVGGALGLGLLL